mmetsp:Transcript_37909/g.100976  ORF Transcript_37909/g.100976 Transcript_37909/m.100976 type:complete len:280 (-) Transcript_37909:642-1481(-)
MLRYDDEVLLRERGPHVGVGAIRLHRHVEDSLRTNHIVVMAAVWQSGGRETTPPCFAAHSFRAVFNPLVTRAAKQDRSASAVLHSTLSPATLCESRKTSCSTDVTRAPTTIRRRPEESFHRRKKQQHSAVPRARGPGGDRETGQHNLLLAPRSSARLFRASQQQLQTSCVAQAPGVAHLPLHVKDGSTWLQLLQPQLLRSWSAKSLGNPCCAPRPAFLHRRHNKLHNTRNLSTQLVLQLPTMLAIPAVSILHQLAAAVGRRAVTSCDPISALHVWRPVP